MPEENGNINSSDSFLHYSGPVDYEKLNILLKELMEAGEFTELDKVTGKRVYSIVVEILENIIKYSETETTAKHQGEPSISIEKAEGRIFIKAGNSVRRDDAERIILKIEEVNNLRESALKDLFERRINEESKKDATGAGLGLILIKMKSGYEITYNMRKLEEGFAYLEITIKVDNYLQ